MDQSAQNWIGKRIGQYEIQSLIKKGGMAHVYYAIDRALERPVALKILFSELTQDETFIERFRREARAVAKLRHPNIVQIYTTGITPDGQHYIAMEYISGGSLREQLDRLHQQGHVLQTTEALKIIDQVAQALAVAHRAGIIHRDLKPSNILLRSDGTPVLTDLGIAKIQDEATLTRMDELVGTPYYMSPEQVNSRPVDARSDIYSVGMILYEMLSGRRAFTGDTPWAILSKHVTETPTPISQLRPDISTQTANVVHTCLQKEPAHRYQTAVDLSMAVKQALQSEQSEQATFASMPSPATVVVPAPDMATQAAAPAGTARREKKRPLWLIPLVLFLLLACAAAAYFGASVMGLLPGNGGTETAVAVAPSTETPTQTPPSTDTPQPSATPDAENNNGAAETDRIDTQTPTTAAPTATRTPKATLTPSPSPSSIAKSTATDAPTNTPTATNTPAASNPTGGSSQGNGLPLTFDQLGVWVRGDEDNGSLTQSSTQTHSGSAAAKLSYDFSSSDNDYVVFMQNNAIPDEPTALQIWVYGDGSGHYLNAWIVDDDGETWQVPFGRINHTGWRQMTGYIDTDQDWPWTHISGPQNDKIDYPISFRGIVLDDVNNAYTGSGDIYLDDLTIANLEYNGATNGGTAGGDTGATTGGGTNTGSGDVGRILYTSGDTILTTDPAWNSPQEVGTAASNTCSSPATTIAGDSYNLYFGLYCTISGGIDVCPSPNGQVEVVVNNQTGGFTITTRPPSTDNFTFVYQGDLDTAEGIRWSPTSDSFLFVVGDNVHRAFVNGNYSQIISTAYTPIFSPDGSMILYLKPVGPGVKDVFVSNADGSNQQNVTNAGGVDKRCHAWRQ